MIATTIRQKLYEYIRVAEDKKVKAIYTMLEDAIEETYNHWEDEGFIKELDRRSNEYKSGAVKGVLWDEAKGKILNAAKPKKK